MKEREMPVYIALDDQKRRAKSKNYKADWVAKEK